MEFLNPERLWLLLLVPALGLLYLWLDGSMKSDRRRRRSSNRLKVVLPRRFKWIRHAAVIAALLSIVSLTVAFAKPKQEVDVPRERATIILVIDVSLSMEATDVHPTRLEAAQKAAKEFVDELPDGFNVGVIAFAGSATTLVEPTPERGPVHRAIDNLQLQRATAIGEGIYAALASLQSVPVDPQNPDEAPPARIVLISDGETRVGRPSSEAAKAAKAMQVPVYTIAYGTKDGYIMSNGRREPVPVNYPELENIAEISGGQAFRADSADKLKQVYEDISSSVGYEKQDVEVTTRYAGIAMIFALVAAVGVASLGARWP